MPLNQTHFKSFKKKFFLHVRVLSAVFKGKFLEGLKQLAGSIFHPDGYWDSFASLLDDLYAKDWVVFSKPVFKCANHVLKYLGRYTHRVAISDYRITLLTDTHVSFDYFDNRDKKKKNMTITREDFVHRFMMHILPHKFVKIRHYGFLCNRFRSEKVTLCRRFIAKQRGLTLSLPKPPDKLQLLENLIGKDKLCCPECGRYFTYCLT